MAGRILIHYMINGGFLRAGGEANRDNNYILDHVDRLKEIPVHIVHGRYDRVSSIPGGSPRAGFARRWQQRGELLYYHGRA
jgi:pimeloyl-ACP methyl ester carboxylesterase